jgi:2-haloacid dehalogenase
MLQPQAVIFDIGNVLTTWNPEAFYDREIGKARRQALFAAVDLHGMNEGLDAGAPFRETVYGFAGANPDWAAEIRLWHDRWIELATPLIDGSIRLQRALRAKGVPVFALSNASQHTFAASQAELPFLREFDRSYISGALGVMKPDPRIYEIVEEDCGLPPESLLFADDRADNITAAARRGWRTHQFESWQGWAARLVAEGLLTQEEAGL